ncbi:hypothetical protein Poli38472_008996 [Pythium oligandrum]|uniref:Uncharacterized protein n=1 Tax=Pythium oligandrum TaxID=41045 RepID=A0A8K1FL32_PYTOL|nr:hypothetical protein Poli38472_008996 [Pythium oligandrum]|eukprot:TMW64829.1 hypothetical protein Poli38472_008996 [Pythium oligandrum]
MLSAVAPTSSEVWIYELQPAYPLPVVDLSISIRSRFLNEHTINRMNYYLVRYMRLISLSAMVGAVMAPLVLILPRTVGGIVSTIVCPLVLMSPAAGIVVLRYKIVCLLVRTYDFWFFFVMSTATLIILAIQVGDVRVAYIPSIWFGMLPHFFVDGALRGVRQMVSIGTIAAMAYLAMLVVVTFGLIPQAPAVTIFRYNKHEVPSDAIISSGFVTVLAMYLRTSIAS